ncbi:unnamed protein product [Alopecurus aequalis]
MASCGELQAVAKGLRWTYALLWQLCPDQGALVWAEGHYNGAIKTRKTVQPIIAQAPAPPEAADHHRSRQLRELFDSLAREAAAGGTSFRDVHGGDAHEAAARRPSAALAPEDLTETEWFYLMCASYCFPHGVGLPGRAFARGGHVWLSRANEADSKVFSRAILAKSAGIQTVLCIPIIDSVLEIGTTENVQEDIGLVQYAMSIFMDQQDNHMIPTMSEHSTSNPFSQIDQQPFQKKRKIHASQTKEDPRRFSPNYEGNEMEDGDDKLDEECASGSETNTAGDYCGHAPLNIVSNDDHATHNAGSSELMQLEMSERVRDGCSSSLGDEIQMQMVCQNINNQSNLQGQDEPCQSWHFLYEELCSGYSQSSGENQAIVSPENAHYTETVLSILHCNTRRQAADPNIRSYLAVSHQSPFSTWHPTIQGRAVTKGATPQRLLKSVLLSSACSSDSKPPDDPGCDNVGVARSRREVDFSANHVLQERKRRENLNERFIVLRSLVPFVTKMDKASILGDTIEYVKQLRKRIQDLESSVARKVDGNPLMIRPPAMSTERKSVGAHSDQRAAASSEKRKLTALEGSSSSSSSTPVAVVQVSIIESDVLLELRCPDRRGLLVRIMQALQEQLRLEVTAVQASSADGVLLAELRTKVRDVHGRRSCISEVKRAIHLIISSG